MSTTTHYENANFLRELAEHRPLPCPGGVAMHMHYRHPEDGEKPCHCPRCGWSGTLHQSDSSRPTKAASRSKCARAAARSAGNSRPGTEHR